MSSPQLCLEWTASTGGPSQGNIATNPGTASAKFSKGRADWLTFRCKIPEWNTNREWVWNELCWKHPSTNVYDAKNILTKNRQSLLIFATYIVLKQWNKNKNEVKKGNDRKTVIGITTLTVHCDSCIITAWHHWKSFQKCVCVLSPQEPIKFLQLADRRSCCDPQHLTGALWGKRSGIWEQILDCWPFVLPDLPNFVCCDRLACSMLASLLLYKFLLQLGLWYLPETYISFTEHPKL